MRQVLERQVRPDRVAIYIRWSTDEQGEGTTLDVQREACCSYVHSQGWQVNPDLVFVDDGHSGSSLRRPALTRLRQLVRDDAVDCVVVFKLDRLSRNVVDTVNLALREWDGRTFLKSAREPIDTSSAVGKQLFYMLAGYAEWERSVIRERTLAGKLRRAQQGRNPGFRRPYGYSSGQQSGSYAVVPAEAALVRRIFDLYACGMGYQAIANGLNQGGSTFRGGRPFSAGTVSEILRNRSYVGDLVYRQRPINPRRATDERAPRQVRNATPMVVHSPGLPCIVEPDLFERVQALRRGRAQAAPPNRAVGSNSLLTGLLRCQHCGCRLVSRRGSGARGTAYYVCARARRSEAVPCRCGYLPQDRLDEFLVQRLLARYGPHLVSQVPQWAADPQPTPDVAWARLTAAQRKHVLRQFVVELQVYRHQRSGVVDGCITWAQA